MSFLIVLFALATWFWLGRFLWRITLAPRLKSGWLRILLGLGLSAIWLLAPFVDEMLGAQEFERACAALPPVKFYGPVSVGPGPFYNEDGSPKWKTKKEFEEIDLPMEDLKKGRPSYLDRLFETRESTTVITRFPVPIIEHQNIYVHKADGQVQIVTSARFSPGGWIKRMTGWGSHAPYQCSRKAGQFPQDEARIKF